MNPDHLCFNGTIYVWHKWTGGNHMFGINGPGGTIYDNISGLAGPMISNINGPPRPLMVGPFMW